MADQTADLDRLLSDGFVDGLADASIEDVRSRRQACEEVEVRLSYLRRLVQGRLDILQADRARRADGGDGGLEALVERLPGILAGSGPGRPPGPGRLPTRLEPEGSHRQLTGELDAIIDAHRLAHVGDLSDADLAALIERLAALERRVSAQRRALHERLDSVQAEIVRRYRTGEVSVDSLLP
ncbi:MAG: hypothetical protein ACRD1K_05250 [Acidimicrobiales bacterium]